MVIRPSTRRIFMGVALTALSATTCVTNGCSGNTSSAAASPALSAAVSNGPQLGYLWNSADNTLRPILGVPGSSQFGQPITTPGLYINAVASPHSSIALLQSANGTISFMTVPQGIAQTINGATLTGSAQIVFSPSGLNAVIYSRSANSILLLTHLATTPQLQTLPAPGNLIAATVSDTALVATVSGTHPLTVALLTGNAAALTTLGGFGGFAFLPGATDLLLADSSTNVITVMRNTLNTPSSQTFTAPSIKTPLAIAASTDGLWAVVANSADPSLVRLDLTSATAPLRIACACQPAQLTALSGNAVFSLNPPGPTPSYVVDASASTPRTVFIPALVQP